jgi:hypothetical protein
MPPPLLESEPLTNGFTLEFHADRFGRSDVMISLLTRTPSGVISDAKQICITRQQARLLATYLDAALNDEGT